MLFAPGYNLTEIKRCAYKTILPGRKHKIGRILFLAKFFTDSYNYCKGLRDRLRKFLGVFTRLCLIILLIFRLISM